MGFFFRIVRRRKRPAFPRKEYLANREAARTLVHARLEYFNQHYHLEYKTVSIKNLRSKWGSCSTRKNLNFSYRIVFLSPELQDYLIVHELCHLKEMHHRESFWDLVRETVPNAEALNRALKQYDRTTLQ